MIIYRKRFGFHAGDPRLYLFTNQWERDIYLAELYSTDTSVWGWFPIKPSFQALHVLHILHLYVSMLSFWRLFVFHIQVAPSREM